MRRPVLPILWVVAIAAVVSRAGAGNVVGGSSSWALCSSKTNYPVSIKDVLIDPDPMVAGDVTTFTIPAFTGEELNGGTLVVTVLFHGIKVHTERDDLCSKSACPIKGDFTLDNNEALPAFTPPGSYTLKFQVLDTAGKELACASVKFTIVWQAELEQFVDAAVALHRKLGK